MTTLTDPVLLGEKDPDIDTIKQWIINGGVDVIQDRLREQGWDGFSQVASVGMFQDDKGKITETQLFISGQREVGRVPANVIWGDALTKHDYLKIDPIDMAQAVIKGRMISEWIKGDKLDWCLKTFNGETGKYRVTDKLSEDSLKAKGASKISLRLHLSLDKGPKVAVKLGVVPVNNIENVVGHGAINFPMIQIGKETKLDFAPREPDDAEWGLGFTPFIINLVASDV